MPIYAFVVVTQNLSRIDILPSARSVLLVDDSAYWTDTLSKTLRDAGFIVTCAHGGLEAVEHIRTQLPDLLITDYFLPDLDGGKLCQLAKKLAADLDITTIILTGGADRNLRRYPSRYADAVIAKNALDVVTTDLMRTLHELEEAEPHSLRDQEVVGHNRLPARALSAKIHGLKLHLEALHEGIGDAVIGLSADRRIHFLNSTAVELFGVPEEVAIARPVEQVLGVDESHPVVKRVDQAFGVDAVRSAPITAKLRANTLRVTVAPLKNPMGEDGALLIAQDVTDLVIADEAKASLTAQLHAADKMRSLGQMTAGISHEINNPLAALLPSLELLRERFGQLTQLVGVSVGHPGMSGERLHPALQEIPELLTDALAAGRQIQSVVGEMRFFAHPGTSKGELSSVVTLLEEAVALVSREVRFKARVDLDVDYSPSLIVDRSLLTQAVLNILINASQAIDLKSSRDEWIAIKSYRSDGGVAIEVSNSGPPIPEEIVDKLFDPFFTTKEPGAGVGLGLSIAYETVARHGGYIEVSNCHPTTFKVWLPLDTGKVLHSMQPPPRSEQQPPPVSRKVRVRVLLVDDERLVRNSFRRVLDRAYDVSLASGGRQALEMIRDNDYDIILCDLLMPEVTGMDLYEKISKIKPDALPRFVFLTGGTACTEAREFLQQVKNARAFKPLENHELLRLVERAVERLGPAGGDSQELSNVVNA